MSVNPHAEITAREWQAFAGEPQFWPSVRDLEPLHRNLKRECATWRALRRRAAAGSVDWRTARVCHYRALLDLRVVHRGRKRLLSRASEIEACRLGLAA